jgi:hypothetical protein
MNKSIRVLANRGHGDLTDPTPRLDPEVYEMVGPGAKCTGRTLLNRWMR